MKTPNKDYNLTKRQGQILRFVAEHGPCSIYQVSREPILKQHYANVHSTVKKLETRNLLVKLPKDSPFGQSEAGRWWVTPRGLIGAIDNGANPSTIMMHAGARGSFPAIESVCNFATVVGTKWFELTSREELLWRYVNDYWPLQQELEKLLKKGHKKVGFMAVPY